MKSKDVSKKKIKVLHVVFSMGHGGIETFLISMLRNYNRDVFHMDIAYTYHDAGKYADEVKGLGARLIPCPLGRDQIRFIWHFSKILHKEKYDAINSHLSDAGAGALIAAKLMGVPARVASYHETFIPSTRIKNRYRQVLRKMIIKCATDITTSSPQATDSHFTDVVAPAGLVQAISYGVDTAYFAQNPKEPLDLKKFGFGPDNLIVGHIGRFVGSKNHHTLIKVITKVLEAVPNARFILRGDSYSPLKKEIESLISENGLAQYIGFVEGMADIREFYDAIDLFVLPSLREGMPVALIEAQASGKAIVASNLNGIEIATAPEMKSNLYAPHDVESFAKCIIDLLRQPEKRISQGKAGQEFVRKNLDIKTAIRKYEQLYLPKDKGKK